MAAAAALFAAAQPASAAGEWTRTEQNLPGSQRIVTCTHQTLGYTMETGYVSGRLQYTNAVGTVRSRQRDVGLKFLVRDTTDAGVTVLDAEFEWPEEPDDPNWVWDIEDVRVSVDGRVVPGSGVFGWYDWDPDDFSGFWDALARGRRLKIEFFDDEDKALATREIDLAPISHAIANAPRLNWTC
jgi:hypothetical protein